MGRHKFPDSPVARIVLSAGRTGTTTLTAMLNQLLGEGSAVHEPFPSKYLYVLGNAFDRIGMQRRPLVRIHGHFRRKALRRDSRQIELNPFLCSVVDQLAAARIAYAGVHLVRDPRTWVASQYGHHQTGSRRWYIRGVPFRHPSPPRGDRSRRVSGDVQRLLYRWSKFNQQISAFTKEQGGFTRLRFEDLFSEDTDLRRDTLASLFEALQLRGADLLDRLPRLPHENISRRTTSRLDFDQWSAGERSYMERVAGEQMASFGYRI